MSGDIPRAIWRILVLLVYVFIGMLIGVAIGFGL